MTRAILRLFVFASGAMLITGPALSASLDSNKPKITVDAPAVKAPVPTVESSEPKVKLDDDTLNAISDPTPTTSKPPQTQQVKPEHVPESVKQPSSASGAPGIQAPKPPATANVPEPRTPGLDQNQLRQMQEMAAAAAAFERMEQIRPGGEAGVLPGRESVDPAAGSAFEGSGIQGGNMNERLQEADELVRDLMYGRAGPFSSDPSTYIGPDQDNDPIFTSPGAAGGGLGDGGIAGQYQSGSLQGRREVTRTRNSWGPTRDRAGGWDEFSQYDDGSSEYHKEMYRGSHQGADGVWRHSGRSWIHTETNADGSSTHYVGYDYGNNKKVDPQDVLIITQTDSQGRERTRTCEGGECGEWSEWSDPPDPPGQAEQPAEGGGWVGNPDACNFNPVTGKCQGSQRTKAWDAITQPSEGDDAGPRGSTPTPGLEAVINPGGEGGNTGRGGGGGGRPIWETMPDPAEGDEEGPGPLPPPGGPTVSASTATDAGTAGAVPSDAGIDEALGELEAPGAE